MTRDQWIDVVRAEALSCRMCGGDAWVQRTKMRPRKGRRVPRQVWVRCRCKHLWWLVEALGGGAYPQRPQFVRMIGTRARARAKR